MLINRRIEIEKRTVLAMIHIFCRNNHGCENLCEECKELTEYALKRLDHCPYSNSKPSCKHCTVHCYAPRQREKIRTVMRFSGPRMIFRHPLLALQHMTNEKLHINRHSA